MMLKQFNKVQFKKEYEILKSFKIWQELILKIIKYLSITLFKIFIQNDYSDRELTSLRTMALWGPDMIKLSLTLLFPYSLQNIIFSSSSFMQTRDPQFVALNFTHHLYSNAAVLTSDSHSRTWSSLWSSLQSPDSEAYASSLGAGRAAPFSLRHSFFTSTVSKIKFSFFFP